LLLKGKKKDTPYSQPPQILERGKKGVKVQYASQGGGKGSGVNIHYPGKKKGGRFEERIKTGIDLDVQQRPRKQKTHCQESEKKKKKNGVSGSTPKRGGHYARPPPQTPGEKAECVALNCQPKQPFQLKTGKGRGRLR